MSSTPTRWITTLLLLLATASLLAGGGTIAGITLPRAGLALLLLVAWCGALWTARRGVDRTLAEMRSLLRDHPDRVVLAVLVLAGAWLRFRGLDYGLPLILHPDESETAGRAIDMLKRGSLNPGWYLYPTFYMNLLLPVFAAVFVNGRGAGTWGSLADVPTTAPEFYLAARHVSAVAGVLAILLTYGIAATLWPGRRGRRVGTAAALLVTVAFASVRQSHHAVTDATLGAVMAAALMAIAAVYRHGSMRHYVVAGLLIGLSISTKYNALPLLLPLLLAHLTAGPERRRALRRPLAATAAVPAGFLTGSPALLLDWRVFLDHLGWLQGFSGAAPGQVVDRFRIVLGYMMESGFGTPWTVILVVAVLLALHRRRPPTLLLVALVLGYLYLVGHSTHRFFPRYLVPIIPACALLAGDLLHGLARRGRRVLRRRGAAEAWVRAPAVLFLAALALVAWPQASESIDWTRERMQTDSRLAALRTIVDTWGPGTVVVTEASYFSVPPGYTLHAWQEPHEHSLAEFRRLGVDLVLLEGIDEDPGDEARQRLLRRLEPVATFRGADSPTASGPDLTLYVFAGLEGRVLAPER